MTKKIFLVIAVVLIVAIASAFKEYVLREFAGLGVLG
jgi:hypothetical protein